VAQAIRFNGREGHLFEIFVEMEDVGGAFTGTWGPAAESFGHPTMNLRGHPWRTPRWFEEALDFRLSDEIGDGLLFFMRCNIDHPRHGHPARSRRTQPLCLGRSRASRVLGKLGDTLAVNGGRFHLGPRPSWCGREPVHLPLRSGWLRRRVLRRPVSGMG